MSNNEQQKLVAKALPVPSKYRTGTEDNPLGLELDQLPLLGVAKITSLGDENLYVEKDGRHYYCKVDFTERFAEGLWDFDAYPEGAKEPNKLVLALPEDREEVVGETVLQPTGLVLVSSDYGFKDYEVSGIDGVHRITVKNGIKRNENCNVYCADSMKFGTPWQGTVEQTLASFNANHKGLHTLQAARREEARLTSEERQERLEVLGFKNQADYETHWRVLRDSKILGDKQLDQMKLALAESQCRWAKYEKLSDDELAEICRNGLTRGNLWKPDVQIKEQLDGIVWFDAEDGAPQMHGPFSTAREAFIDAIETEGVEQPEAWGLQQFQEVQDTPADPEGMNNSRSDWAETALQAFINTTGTEGEDALKDLLCDLMHWSDRNGFDFAEELAKAKHHYEEETLTQ